MKKPYLLIAGDYYYPSADTGDWIGCFETHEEAKAQVEVKKETSKLFRNGRTYYVVNGHGDRKFDWYEIVDLRCWQ